ncbi:GGDEF domain-containing protein [Herbaspirillum sp.]|uniref:GGDEF domain-containing protein n=1 Tax=Herbaspirillum sp. TaxID=1890675 RepID=UPI001B177ECE|nr:GGDEF domain-containing protein [Herbaspirillum sp.]MBO9535605.1 GGDEF domain-containing protein [Herbaspirillum sp.]
MNPFTASIALAIVQFCSGLIMAGVFLSTPTERCTRYWALSGALAALAICLIVPIYAGGGGSWRPIGLMLGNTSLFASSIAAWSGLRCFYQRPARWWPWLFIAAYAVSFSALLALEASFTQRSYLAIGAMQLVFFLVLFEFRMGLSGPQAGRYARWSFGRWIGFASVTLLSAAYIARLALAPSHPELFEPPRMSDLGVALIYLIPLGGSLLFSAALLMLYFERLVADKQRLATEDELTHTLNRRELVRCGEQMLHDALARGHSLTLAFIDVDHFKQINDRFGHQVGDRVLAGIAAVLREHCRESDLLGRYGGEEFCAVFPGLTQLEADRIGERLVAAVREHAFDHGQTVTISAGLVVLQPGQVQNWDELVNRADIALYRAKSEGRNAFRMAQAA